MLAGCHGVTPGIWGGSQQDMGLLLVLMRKLPPDLLCPFQQGDNCEQRGFGRHRKLQDGCCVVSAFPHKTKLVSVGCLAAGRFLCPRAGEMSFLWLWKGWMNPSCSSATALSSSLCSPGVGPGPSRLCPGCSVLYWFFEVGIEGTSGGSSGLDLGVNSLLLVKQFYSQSLAVFY